MIGTVVRFTAGTDTPWQNLGFYYNSAGIGYSDQTIHIGRYDATAEELARFEGQKTTVEIVDG